MLRVGLTGGIGAGKSTVAARLAELGAIVVDSDRIAREVVEPGTDGLAEVVAEFGDAILTPEGRLDRPALASKVFGDDAARARLNAIVHPKVRDRAVEMTANAPADAIVVQDVPLLVENGMAPAFHLVIVVDADVELRVHRLTTGRGMAEQDARARVAAQASQDQRRAAADVWLDNSGTPEQVLAAVDELWEHRLVPFEANIRLGRYPSRGGPKIVPHDQTWPEQAERIMKKIRLAAGHKGQRVDHIGSTSVPGLAAKDVIDLQLTVAALADADAIAERLGQAGFPLVPDLVQDTPKPVDPNPEHWMKRVHCGADPGRWVNLHVRVAGWPNWRYALLFPAWLRADAEVRSEYETFKRRLADEHAGRSIYEYGEAKDPWFDGAHVRAERWAERTSWSPPS